jgi:hypothetical protein
MPNGFSIQRKVALSKMMEKKKLVGWGLMINVSNAMRFRHPGVDGQDEKDTQSSST